MTGSNGASAASKHSGKPTILVTNDDGVDPKKALVVPLGKVLAELGLDVTVVAPGRNNSACGMSITIANSMTLRRHPDYEEAHRPSSGTLRIFSILEGTPADCTAAAIEPSSGILSMLGLYPRLVVSGINLGSNLGTDTIYSGTVAGARQGCIYGIPGIASSLAEDRLRGHPEREQLFSTSLRATVQLVQAVLGCIPEKPPRGRFGEQPDGKGADGAAGAHSAFLRGDLLLNVNVPGAWDGTYTTAKLDQVLYRDILRIEKLPDSDEGVPFNFGGSSMHRSYAAGSDSAAVRGGSAGISVVQTFPWSSPRWLSEEAIEEACVADKSGMPAWIAKMAVVCKR